MARGGRSDCMRLKKEVSLIDTASDGATEGRGSTMTTINDLHFCSGAGGA
jgi:hypothetical protein